MVRKTKPTIRIGNFGSVAGIRLKYRVTGAGISKSDYTRKVDAMSDYNQRKRLYRRNR